MAWRLLNRRQVKKIIGFGLVGSLALLPSVIAVPNKVQVGYSNTAAGNYGDFQSGLGGEFTLNPNHTAVPGGGHWLDLSGYVAGKSRSVGPVAAYGTFQSFCIEYDEHIHDYPKIYDVTIGPSARDGGVAGPSPDPVSKGAGYLYSHFAKGTLSGYDFTSGPGSARKDSAADLQNALWMLEEEVAMNLNNKFIKLLVSAGGLFEGDIAAAMADGAGMFGVSALNLWDAGYSENMSRRGQDQLYYRRVPDTGTTAVILGMGFFGLLVFRRKQLKMDQAQDQGLDGFPD